MMKKLIPLALAGILTAGCGPKIKSERLTVAAGDKKGMEITDEWLTTDTNLASKFLLEKLLSHNRYKRYLRERDYKTPRMFVGEVENRTSEDNFPITALNNKILNDLFETGDVDLVSAKDRDKILGEIKYQNNGMVKSQDVKSIGKASGADIMLFGEVIMEEKKLGGKTLREYSISLRLTDIESGEEISRALFETTKYSKRKKIGW
ncbi:MAG: penicillin-binding protein activator LpoB [Rickettsiales bacterium]|jgi:PBP1b-binding outer membrane lipoprotein LpoB|nr:penicillin-binding protein activator LpoB [Rickettsiales bacterium]